MGSGSTKILSYDDACKRCMYEFINKIKYSHMTNEFIFHLFVLVHSTDLERIEITFRDLTNGTGELSYTSFKRDVFAQFLPEKLAAVGDELLSKKSFSLFQRLYQVCTSSSRTCMSIKDLVCCLALIYYGTTKERMQRKNFTSVFAPLFFLLF